MTTETDLTKKQLALILSALDDAPRNPANKGEALRVIGRSAARIGLTAEDVLAAAPGLLDERLAPAEFRAEVAGPGWQQQRRRGGAGRTGGRGSGHGAPGRGGDAARDRGARGGGAGAPRRRRGRLRRLPPPGPPPAPGPSRP
jgi:hypothetical protein